MMAIDQLRDWQIFTIRQSVQANFETASDNRPQNPHEFTDIERGTEPQQKKTKQKKNVNFIIVEQC